MFSKSVDWYRDLEKVESKRPTSQVPRSGDIPKNLNLLDSYFVQKEFDHAPDRGEKERRIDDVHATQRFRIIILCDDRNVFDKARNRWKLRHRDSFKVDDGA